MLFRSEVKQHAPSAKSISVSRIDRDKWKISAENDWPYKWPKELFKTLPGVPNFLDDSPYPVGFHNMNAGSSSSVSEEQVTKAIDMLVQKSFTSEDFANLCNRLNADIETVEAAIMKSKNKKYFNVDTDGEIGRAHV